MAKICVLAGYAPSLVNFRGALLTAFRQGGHTVSVSAPEDGACVAETLAALEVEYFQVPMARAGIDPRGDLRYLFGLWRALRRRRPDLVLAYTIKPVTFGLLAARLVGVRRRVALITGLGYAFMGSTSLRRRLVRRVACSLYRWALRGAECVFFQNSHDRLEFEQLGILDRESRVCLVNGSGVDLTHFVPVPTAQTPTFLLIARLLREKGVMEYVMAAERVRRRFPSARFILVGGLDPNPGAITRAELETWVRDGVIDYWGEMKDVRPALSACSVYVLPSFYREGLPRTILEAMAVGRPIITTDAPGCRETVSHGDNGFLVPIRDVDSLAEAMMRFIESPELVSAMAKRSREIAEAKYDVQKVNATMLAAMRLTGAD